MIEKATLRAVPNPQRTLATDRSTWSSPTHEIVVGKDVLELLSTSMYLDPLTIYREYVQNAADAIDQAREQQLFKKSNSGRVDITIDAQSRRIRIRDDGTGIPSHQFATRLSNLGASSKRGTSARGFRGVGRLAGLGYCQELIFRSRVVGEQAVSEMRWDCRALRAALRSADQGRDLTALMHEIIEVRQSPAKGLPERFFEVELNGVIRHRDDRLLNQITVGDYLSQVAPVPFAREFRFGSEIASALRPHVRLCELEIYINGSETPIFRPHRNAIKVGEKRAEKLAQLELHELTSIDGGVGAIAWILHHGYSGAIPPAALIKGLRLRTGNIQTGDHALLEDLFPESRFNAWAVGEVHILDSKVLPNGRRDHFEQSVHFDNLVTQLTPIAREIARRCRQSSIARRWVREFELHKSAAIETARIVRRGGLSRAGRKTQTDAVARALKAMRKVLNTPYLGVDTRAALETELESTEARIKQLLGAEAREEDVLLNFNAPVRAAYQQVISLIYDCCRNRPVAAALVDKILDRLAQESKAATGTKRSTMRRSTKTKRPKK
jgi:molecular chaperone HtpG